MIKKTLKYYKSNPLKLKSAILFDPSNKLSHKCLGGAICAALQSATAANQLQENQHPVARSKCHRTVFEFILYISCIYLLYILIYFAILLYFAIFCYILLYFAIVSRQMGYRHHTKTNRVQTGSRKTGSGHTGP